MGRHAGAHPPCVLPEMPRSGGARGQPERRRDRQPEREKRGKGGASIDPPGYDAGKKIKGKKRHLLVDTLGLILTAVVHRADLQDWDGAVLVLDRHTGRRFPFLETIFADAAYAGEKLRRAMAGTPWKIEVVRRSDQAKGFQVIPKRWVVERSRRDGAKRAPGSIDAAASPRTTKTSTAAPSASSASPASGLCCEDSHDTDMYHKLAGRNLIGYNHELRLHAAILVLVSRRLFFYIHHYLHLLKCPAVLYLPGDALTLEHECYLLVLF